MAARPMPPSTQSRQCRRLPDFVIFSAQAWKEIAKSLKLTERELHIMRGVFDDRDRKSVV